MTEQELKIEEHYLRVGIPFVQPDKVLNYIRAYVEVRKEMAPRKRISVHTEIIDMSPIFEHLEDNICTICDGWQRAFWLSELERYKKETYIPPSTPLSYLIAMGGI